MLFRAMDVEDAALAGAPAFGPGQKCSASSRVFTEEPLYEADPTHGGADRKPGWGPTERQTHMGGD